MLRERVNWVNRGIGVLWVCARFFLAIDSYGDELNQPWQFQGPTGRVSDMLNLYTERLIGFPEYQERLDFELEGSLSNSAYTIKAIPWAWTRILDSEGGVSREARAFFELKEGWIERVSPAWELRIGNQIFAWGAADQINPTDVWNPRDYYDLFQSYKLPILAARLKIHPPSWENFSFELIATPLFRESRLPVVFPEDPNVETNIPLDSSRWLVSMPTKLFADPLTFPLIYDVTAASYPATWQVGGRAQFMRVGEWDFSTSVYSGVENIPRLAVTKQGSTGNPSLPVTITFHPSFHRELVFGVDGSGSVSPWGVDIGTRFEAAFYRRDNSRVFQLDPSFQADLLKDNYVWAVLGVDHTLKHKVLGTVLYGNLQFVYYQRIGNVEQTTGALIIQGLPAYIPWDRDLVLYLEDRINSKLKAAAQIIGSFQNKDGMISPVVKYQWTDNLNTALGADIYYGNINGFFGQFRDNRRVNLFAGYSF